MKKKITVLLCSIALSPTVVAQQFSVETKFSSYSNSESIPIVSLVDDSWLGSYQKANSLFTINRFELSLGTTAWQFGVAKRFDYFAKYSEKTMDLFYRENNKLEPRLNQHYPIRLDVEHALSSGAFIRYRDSYQQIDYQVTFNYWQSEKVMSGLIEGDINTDQLGKFSGLLNFDYSYDKDTLFKRPVEAVDAKGFSIDVNLAWQINQQVDLKLAVIDLYHQLRWDDVTHTKAVLDRTPDKASRTASVSGKEDHINLKQRFDAQSYLNLSYRTDWGRWQLGLDYINQKDYPYIGISNQFDFFNGEFELAYYPDNRAIKLGVSHPHWGLSLIFNTLDIDNANTLGITTYLKY